MGKKKSTQDQAPVVSQPNSTHGVQKHSQRKNQKKPINVDKLKCLFNKKPTPAPSQPTEKLEKPAGQRVKPPLAKGAPPPMKVTDPPPVIGKLGKPKGTKPSLAEEARVKLESARFRYLNEQLYTTKSDQAWALFQEDPQSFHIYHKGFSNQVARWPVNPLDVIIRHLKEQPKDWIIADFGCGEARLSLSLPNKVHSFDLVAANERVTACDMAHVPLAKASVDAAVFCLSLMGKNIQDFLVEANRVLKMGAILYLAEVESRCTNIEEFLRAVEKFGFKLKNHKKHRFFFFAAYTKNNNISPKATFPRMQLKPCLYKKR